LSHRVNLVKLFELNLSHSFCKLDLFPIPETTFVYIIKMVQLTKSVNKLTPKKVLYDQPKFEMVKAF